MDNFLTCLCDLNIQALIISGDVPEAELQVAWLGVLEEYYELKGNEPGAEWYLNRDIIRLQNHLKLVGMCVDFLEVRYSEKVAHGLTSLGYPFRPVVQEPNSYRNLLQAVINKSRGKYVILQQLVTQFEQRSKETKEHKPPPRDYFETLGVYIEEMQGTAYNFETLTVNKFVALEKKYWKQVDFLKEKAKK